MSRCNSYIYVMINMWSLTFGLYAEVEFATFCLRTKGVALLILPLGNGVSSKSTSFDACILTLRTEEQGCKTVEVTEISQAAIQRKIFVYNHLLSGDMFILQS